MKKRTTTCLAAAALLWSASAQAQESLLAGKNATEGKTDVANEGFEKVDVPSTENDVTELKLAAGGLMATGNSRSMAGTATGKARIRRKQNQYSADVAANYAESAPDLESDREVTVENYQGRIRYDRFLSERWALFAEWNLSLRDELRLEAVGLCLQVADLALRFVAIVLAASPSFPSVLLSRIRELDHRQSDLSLFQIFCLLRR